MRDLRDIKRFWQAHKEQQLALCTLIKKSGSSYRPVGAKKMVARAGRGCGLLSGGCLEAAIEKTARERWDEMPFRARFSTMSDEDRVMGYQAGCAGIIEILFERLPQETDAADLYLPFGAEARAAGIRIALDDPHLAQRVFVDAPFVTSDDAFFDPWQRPITLSVVGCGPDAAPFGEFAALLGWDVKFFDYRPSYVDTIPGAECLPAANIAAALTQGAQAAVVLMTHNYQADLDILAGLVGGEFAYLGCLGPRKRYERMKLDLHKQYGIRVPRAWEKIVCAPAGFVIKSQTPEDIALTIVAQIQSAMSDPAAAVAPALRAAA